MRRGLMGWDESELPKAALAERRAKLLAAMARDGFEAFLLYTNIVRPAAVSWLTAFTPYWIESLLLLPREGVPVLATALSKRVADWIRNTSWVEDIINTPKPGTAIGQRLAESRCKRLGVLELDALPAGLYDDLAAAAPGAELIDAGPTFARCRRAIDDSEKRLIAHADRLAVAALEEVDVAHAKDAGMLAGLLEKHARLGAAEEAYIEVAPDLDGDRRLVRVSGAMSLGRRFAVRASVAYRGSWVRRTRSFARDDAGERAMARGDAWLSELRSTLAANVSLAGELAAALNALPGAGLKSFTAESSVGSYPLEVVASSRSGDDGMLPARSFAVLSAELGIDGVPWLGAAPVVVGG